MHWYCLHTKPLKEAQVASYCTSQLGLQTYFPRLRQHRVIRRQRRLVTRPLFPRYLFCRFDASTLYRAVRYAPEILDIVSSGAAPTVVHDSLIENLQSWAGNEVDIFTLQPSFRVGNQVEVTTGRLQVFSPAIAPPGRAVAGWQALANLLAALGGPRYASVDEIFAAVCLEAGLGAGRSHREASPYGTPLASWSS